MDQLVQLALQALRVLQARPVLRDRRARLVRQEARVPQVLLEPLGPQGVPVRLDLLVRLGQLAVPERPAARVQQVLRVRPEPQARLDRPVRTLSSSARPLRRG